MESLMPRITKGKRCWYCMVVKNINDQGLDWAIFIKFQGSEKETRLKLRALLISKLRSGEYVIREIHGNFEPVKSLDWTSILYLSLAGCSYHTSMDR